ncbi:GDSL-like Lipase/Acylhydrolase family protein [Actinokineospora alba]|uniref:GDSL-like Lipase/Acylhydrolase family protein n=1 Tax=Actinokineospora alba TaxID=504798 RepID=A0A1H0F2S7_9PSEU|nr:SGNH/GDSL hydrolase family protein [Actinokineospora alba]TDP69314.1 GDSL-like lipase/acylhydrolase family protein [Actinokineospora alba]SDI19503.1 GDSL-like Lipase/Acylhydrolase family protein [Actinokineospora alba]SDN88836.1 GDSL-like Lipase/Acylhydrolase family protein [Actinokineospora alba]
MSRRKITGLLTAGIAAVGLVAGGLHIGSATAAPYYPSYVALGDSFSSASGVPNQVDLLCTRSDHNYPSLVSKAVKPATFTDVTCGAAVTADMTGNQFAVVAPQFNALKPDTALVTVGIGGNDIPFAEILATCGLPGALVPIGSPCKTLYTAGGGDRRADKVKAVGPKVDGVLKGIKQRSPKARVLLVGYPVIMPENGSNCWPLVPIASGDAPYLRDITKLLNSVLSGVAANNGATFVDTYTSSIGHDVCQFPGVKWMEGVFASGALPVHPNALGTQNQARQVLAALGG